MMEALPHASLAYRLLLQEEKHHTMSKIVAPPLLTLWLFLQTVPILSLLMVLVFLMVPEISEALPLLVTNILTILIIVIIVT